MGPKLLGYVGTSVEICNQWKAKLRMSSSSSFVVFGCWIMALLFGVALALAAGPPLPASESGKL